MLLRSLVLLLVAGCAYIAGIMTELALDPELDTESRVKALSRIFLLTHQRQIIKMFSTMY